MSKIFYTSDLHFGHDNIRKYENRPWDNIDDMTEGLIERWNSIVSDKDDIYILGDFAWKGSNFKVDDINTIVKRLKGKKHLIVGNHDLWIYNKDCKPYYWEEIIPYKEIVDGNHTVILCHYPIETWNKQHFGSIHIHGHLHSHDTKINQLNRYNCGCDRWNWYPVTLQEMIDKLGYYEIKGE